MTDIFPESREEEILVSTINGEEYDKAPESRIEALLLELKEVIEEGGGGGGTTNYNLLINKPSINGVTLTGDNSLVDLGVTQEVKKVMDMITEQFSTERNYNEGDIVIYNKTLYTFITDHEIGDFNPLEVEQTDIYELLVDVYVAISDKQSNLNATKDSNNNVIFSGKITDGDGNTLSDVAKSVTKIYGFHISDMESDPSAKVTYLADAVGYTPAGMDYVNNRFNYGSWQDVFFMPRPCMLKQDGTVDYYLDPNDYSKKEDGTVSDVANTAYNGNAMMEWPKIYMKIVPDSGDSASFSVYFSNKQVDTDYHAWPYIDGNGVEKEHFYTAIYNSKVVDGVARSLSGQIGTMKSKTAADERTALRANNASGDLKWDMETYADRMLVTNLAILISKTTDSQTAFGKGLSESGNDTINDAFTTGIHNTKGLFYGTNSGAASTYTNANKIFGMENYMCFQWRRLQGLVIDNGVIKTKLCYGQSDGSTADDYSFDATGYVEGASLSTLGDTNGQCNKVVASDRGFVLYHAATPTASSSTYYCCYHWINLSDKRVPFVGGFSDDGAYCGLFYFDLSNVAANARWYFGAALSCR